MGARQTAKIQPNLTTYAAGLWSSIDNPVGQFMAPWAVLPNAMGQYKKYDQVDAFVVYDTARAIGGPARRIEFSANDAVYNAQPQALEVGLDDSERPQSVPDAAKDDLNLENKTRALVNLAWLAFNVRVVEKAKTTAAEVNNGAWADPQNNPVAEINANIRAIATKTGRMPNRICWGLAAWERFSTHPKVVGRLGAAVMVDKDVFVIPALFTSPGIRHLIAADSQNANNPGVAPSNENLLGDDLFIFYANSLPTNYDPSWMTTFTTGRGGIDKVYTYRAEQSRSEIVSVDWSEDTQIISNLCCKRITTHDLP